MPVLPHPQTSPQPQSLPGVSAPTLSASTAPVHLVPRSRGLARLDDESAPTARGELTKVAAASYDRAPTSQPYLVGLKNKARLCHQFANAPAPGESIGQTGTHFTPSLPLLL
ncbi:hypothetical protein PTTG_25126 [Puccinia triticina 1-1 BBBD Race 1]|uniref:Uncharacterized protein n=1 Tax=Puccinia triticina (isolate 1-1 / race 1 (BBBD)) TaxID=630390 RepID=A0A180H4Q8_PUCT1|nr:hypothetical protein PTTG_25126 [Puccinia triticina 1-1 BBBD Race 1]